MGKAVKSIAQLIETSLAPREIVNKKGISPYENPSKVAATKGLRYLQDHVEKDAHYLSIITTRINSLLAAGWKVVPASRMVDGKKTTTAEDVALADFMNYALSNMSGSFEKDITAMMTHISRGFSVSEINYKFYEAGPYKGKVGLDSIRFKEQEFFSFAFDEKGHYKLMQVDPEPKELDLNKFIHFINGFNDENPYGDPLSAVCAFYVYMKECGTKYWSIFAERFGQPLALLKVENSLTPEQQEVADSITDGIQEATSLQVPKAMVLEFLEATRSGEASYRGYLDFANSEMSKAVLGSTLTVEAQKNASGSHALGKEHAEVMKSNFNFDIISSQAAINQQLVRRLIDYNFADVEYYPRFQWNVVNSSGFISFAQGISALAQAGVQIPVAWIYETLSIPVPQEGEEVLEISSGWPMDPLNSPAGTDNNVLARKPGSRPETFASKRAKNEAAANERIVRQATGVITERWMGLVEKIAKTKKFDFDICAAFDEKEVAVVIGQVLIIAALRGYVSAYEETGANLYQGRGQRRKFKGYQPFEDVIKDFKGLKILPKDKYNELVESCKRLAFTVARQESIRVLGKIKGELDILFSGDSTLPDFYESVVDLFNGCGVIGKGNHIETVMRTNLQTQYTESRMSAFEELDGEEFPFMQINVIQDDATRDRHRALDNYTRRKDDPVWSWLRPPLEYNCRCTVRAVHVSEEAEESDWIPDKNDYEFTRGR